MVLFGTQNFLPWCALSQSEIQSWLEKLCELNIQVAQRQVEAGCDAIVIDDDVAYNQGTFIDPEVLRKVFFPYTKKLVESIKSRGVPVIRHSDGYLMDILPDWLDMGIDGLHSIQPSAGMDIVGLKRAYGDRLVLLGNVDIDLLGRGTPEQVAQEVRRLIDTVGPGGGYILSSSNVLGHGTSPENALAIYETAESYR